MLLDILTLRTRNANDTLRHHIEPLNCARVIQVILPLLMISRFTRGSRECAVLDKPWIQDFEMYQGQIKTWFNFLPHMTAAHKGTAVSCWRGKHCSSEAVSVKLWTWIPVILTIEPANMAGQSHLDFTDLVERNWDFPRTLAPLTLREAKEKGLEYVVVSRIFKNHNHFITRSIIPTPGGKPAIFTYDGMKHAGFSQLERGSIDELMTGASLPVPKGYYTYAVIYRLRGGPSAQEYLQLANWNLSRKSCTSISWFPHCYCLAFTRWRRLNASG